MKNATIATIARLGKHARLLGCSLAALCWASTAHADLTIIEDTFTAADETPIGSWDHVYPGTACSDEAFSWQPSTYLPGPAAGWMINVHYSPRILGNQMRIGADSRGVLRLGSTGSYARPSKLRISADMTVAGCDQDGGFWLGYNTSREGQGSLFSNFTGLALSQSGRLAFRKNGGEVAGVDWSGGASFDKDAPYLLSYEMDTTTGNISNVSLAGSTADYSNLVTAAAGQFTLARTPYACVYSRCGNGGQTGYIDNFKVERVGNALSPAIGFTPVDGAKYTSAAHIIGNVSIIDGTGPFSVQYYLGPVGSAVAVGSPVTTAPYQADLGTLPNGTYEVYAEVTDGSPTTVASAHSTITVQDGTGLLNIDFAQDASDTQVGAAAIGSPGDSWNPVNYGYPTDRPSAGSYSPTVVALKDSSDAFAGVTLTETWSDNNLVNQAGSPSFDSTPYKNLMYDGVGYDYTITLTGLTPGVYDLYLYSPYGWSRYVVNGVQNTQRPFVDNDVLADHTIVMHPVVAGDGVLTIEPLNHGDHIDKLCGFQLKAVPANTPPVVTTVRPANGQTYSTASSITAKADFYYGTPPYTVQFWVDGSQVGGNVTAPPYEMPLGSLSLGSHTVFTRVIDSSTGAGPYTVDSATNTFSVAAPAITVDKDWTWNAGPEVDFSNFLTGSSTLPVHSEGQVIVPSGTYLRAQNVLSNSPVNFGMEVIVTQQDASTENRWIASARTPSWADVFQFRMSNQSFWARNDQWGDWSQVDSLAVGSEHRMAIIITASPGDTQAVTSYYLDNVFVGSRSEPLTLDIFSRSPVRDVSIGVWHGDDAGSAGGATAPAISVNQIRVFHFGADMFSPSLLLTAPTTAPDQAPEVTVVTPTEGQLFLTLDSVSLSSYVAYGTPPFSVQYSKRLVGGGAFSAAGAPATTPPYAVNLGTLAAGSYEIKATVTDSNGVPRSSDSAIRTITVAAPAITVDKQYTFNNGAEADLPAFGGDSPVYADGQVTLPPNAYLQGAGLYSLSYRNFGMEVIVTQTSDTDQWRPIMHVGSTPWGNPGFHILAKKGDPRILFRDDQVGDLGNATGVPVVGTEYRLAVVVTPKPDGNVLKSFYLNGVLVGTRSDGVWDGWTLDNLMLGNCSQGIGWDGPNTTIKINEARIFHFAEGRFHPSLLLTGPTPGGGGGSPYSTWAGGQAFTDDLNGDGVDNGMAWILGAANANANLDGLLPVPGADGGLTMHFHRVNPMGTAHLYVEYSSDLGDGDPWHSEEIPATSGTIGGDIGVVVVPGSPTDDVTITIPASHGSAGALYGRLKAVENPPD